ncbi:GntR family transcriptional regulator [Brevibacterium sp. BRM-1]|uniref:GntR family transcriptional regulator n=1 Tax=Brevibacterium sp. BRM-1 TaxID=2999062 RepID=UPI00227F7861|nr:GntR family transcriptional regulator [Brevibacterium sp. BRM-1]WAL39781.1 GntR family transcriptional regulator [Brevibacterium sp. BRM-1]
MPTKRDAIVEALRRRILGGEIERGSRLRQDEVATWFDASITPVREAFHRLEAEGLVVSEAHRGVRVAGIDLERFKALYVTRMLLEPYAMRRAVLRISRHELKGAYALLDELAQANAAGDGSLRNLKTREFHFFFYRHCGMPGLVGEIEAKWDSFPWDFTLDDAARADQSHHEHIELVEAVRSVDGEAAARLTAEHIRRGFLSLSRKIVGAEIEDPFDVDVD